MVMKKVLKKLLLLMVVSGLIAGVFGGPLRPGPGDGGSNSVVETEESAEI